ncbi:hypothetical protein ACLOJK_018932 [Asimina triloba]
MAWTLDRILLSRVRMLLTMGVESGSMGSVAAIGHRWTLICRRGRCCFWWATGSSCDRWICLEEEAGASRFCCYPLLVEDANFVSRRRWIVTGSRMKTLPSSVWLVWIGHRVARQ